MQKTQVWSLGWEDPLEKGMQPTPVFLPGKSHGQRSLVSYSPWGHRRVRRDWATNTFTWFLLLYSTLFLSFTVQLSILYISLLSIFSFPPPLPSDKYPFYFQGQCQSHTPGRHHFSSPWTSYVHCFTTPMLLVLLSFSTASYYIPHSLPDWRFFENRTTSFFIFVYSLEPSSKPSSETINTYSIKLKY